MDPSEYQKLAARTECNQTESYGRICITVPSRDLTPGALVPVRLLHAVIGLTGDAGELAAAVERWLYYGQSLDAVNVEEEIGDCLWYLAQACNAIGLDMGEVMEANIRKLRQRYPDKFDEELSKEENRDREAEREVLEQTGQGWEESPFDEELKDG